MTKVKDLIAALQEFGGEEEVGVICGKYEYDCNGSGIPVDPDITLYRVDRKFSPDLPNGGVIVE